MSFTHVASNRWNPNTGPILRQNRNKTWGPLFARSIRKKRGSSFTDKWHIDEVRLKIKGEVFWLWRLVDSEGEEIEILLQRRRNAKAAIRFLKKALPTHVNRCDRTQNPHFFLESSYLLYLTQST